MKAVALRGVADDLHHWLQERADRTGRSVNAEILQLLEAARADDRRAEQRLVRLQAFRSKYVPEAGFGLLDETIEDLRRSREDR